MSLRSLDEFLGDSSEKTAKRKQTEIRQYESFEDSAKLEEIEFQKLGDVTVPRNLPPSYFVSATYDGKRRKACIKLYEPHSQCIYLWYDTKGHKPYCFTNITPKEIEKIEHVINHPGYDHAEIVEKYDALTDRKVKITKIVAADPLAIGGRPQGCIRDIIPQEYPQIFGTEKEPKVWEAAIKYYQCFIYDQDLSPGMVYKIENGELEAVSYENTENTIRRIVETFFKDESEDLLPDLQSWTRLCEYPAPRMRRAALDIEVLSPVATRIPDPEEAEHPVVCVSLVGSDEKKRVLLLRRESVEDGNLNLPPDVTVEFYNSEKDLILSVFRALNDYPFILTFNGDDFDLRYLFHRAEKLGFRREDIPIDLGRKVCLLNYGVHIDLYKFFFNRSIQIYAFSQKYRNVTLDEVSKTLLGKSKLTLSKPFRELSYTELAQYCLNDSEITFGLSTYSDELVMKLLIILTRISRMPMEDMSRQGVSRWIRSFMQYEHRKRGMLIPNSDDIIAAKGTTATKAVIKGKKYKGAIVVNPVPGVHFNLSVMDFQSLYPSIIKVHNLGYQTVRCTHEEDRDNKIIGTPHWICKKNRAIESALIGSLRDLRVRWYKPKAKDSSLPKEQRNWYNVIQNALKVILNASYGVFGAETFDLYCPPAAEATATIGRNIINQTIEEANNLGIEVIYGDTDSLFLKNPHQEQVKTLSRWAEKTLGMELETDKSYRYAVLSSRKKNYLGVFPDGSVDVKGLTGKKRHIPLFIKKYFDEMENRLSQVKTPGDFELAKKDVAQIVRECYMKLRHREWDDLNELAFEVVLGKIPRAYNKTTPQHVKAAFFLQERGMDLRAGDTIRFVKVSKDPHVKPVQLASNKEIDVEKYIAYLRSTFDQILDALGLEFDEIIGLTRLEQFM